MDAIPNTIHEGMKVCDSAMQVIGTVETFRITDEAPDQPGTDAAGVSPVLEDDRQTLTGILADVFRADDELPREMQEKALREGFVRLDVDGLFAADRYIFPEQIDRVEGDRLVLSVSKDQLLKV
jgi:Asp-tRNA(Asn)/Glu-tRNA(Gln) amidotransferase C subunit